MTTERLALAHPAIDPFAYVESLAQKEGRHFAAGYGLLDGETRRAMYALYAFCRISDDIADEPLPGAQEDETAERRRQFAAWREGLRGVWRDVVEAEVPRRFDGVARYHPALLAVAEVARSRGLSRETLEAIVDGCESDLDRKRYETYDELLDYIEKVAVSVGLAMLEVFGRRNAETEPPMRALGEAFQITNILRDISEDHGRDRVYLPREDLAARGVDDAAFAEAVRTGRAPKGLVEVVADYADRARRRYRASDPLFAGLLPAGPRKAVRSMRLLYEAILDEIALSPADVFVRPPSIPYSRKLALLFRAAALG